METSLRQKTVRSFLWQSAGTVGAGIVGMIVTMLLAHHLTPKDFGTIEIILSFAIISEVLVDSGFSQAIIREKDLDNKDLSAVFMANLAISITLYIILFLIAPTVKSFFNLSDDFIILFRVLNVKILIDAFAFSQTANCIRQMRFDITAQASVIAITIAGTLSVVAVILGLGVWSLIIYYLILSLGKTLYITIRIKWRPAFRFKLKKLKEFVKFGGNLMLAQLLDKVITSIESLCVGKAYTKSDLGNFSQARKLDSLIIQTLLSVVQKVSYPALAKIENTEHLKASYKEIMQLAFWVVIPLAMFFFFNSENVICTLFGKQWINAAPYFRLFSIYSMIFPIQSISVNIFMVKKKTNMYRNISITQQILRVTAIIILTNFSIFFFACGIVFISFLTALIYIIYGGRLINYSLLDIILDNSKSLISAILAGIMSIVPSLCFKLSIVEAFLINGIIFLVIYFTLTLILKNPIIKSLKTIFSPYKGKIHSLIK